MNYREKMRKAVSSPYDGSARTYGEWGALRPDQRAFILRLLDEMDSADAYVKTLYQENQQLKEQQKEFISWLIENESLDDYCNETTFTSIREKYEKIIGSDVNE